MMTNSDALNLRADLLQRVGWHRAIGGVIQQLDTPLFWSTLIRLLGQQVPFDSWVALIFNPHQPPLILAESDEDDGTDDGLFLDYQQGLYLLDPFYLDQSQHPRSGLVTLAEVAPEHFTHTDYYQRYFSRNIVADEVQFNCTLGSGQSCCLSLGRRHPFDMGDIGALALMEPWVIGLLQQRTHFEPAYTAATISDAALPIAAREDTLAVEGSPLDVLTERERDVCQLMLSGCSTKEIARRLNIAIETVKAHKKRIYTKLGINAQSELFSLFMQAHSR
ncbi:response regulator transcription factor [Terasakiispira papahanaumokuakeensis]|nr:helix-turn-helix transcriptional regulator [Terasakiispira papahanaumokuakeensis]